MRVAAFKRWQRFAALVKHTLHFFLAAFFAVDTDDAQNTLRNVDLDKVVFFD